MKINQCAPNTDNNLESTGWDPTMETTEEQIRDYFTKKTFDQMFGSDWRFSSNPRRPDLDGEEIDFDFASYIRAATDHAENNGLLTQPKMIHD